MSQQRHESPELGAAAARIMRALVRRASDGDSEALEQLAALELLAPVATQLAGWSMNRSDTPSTHYSCGELAQVLGISRQAAVKRFRAFPLDPQGDTEGLTFTWASEWLRGQTSSGAVMRGLVKRLTGRRAAS